MTANRWNWKGKDGSRGGLLYESGNWGDLLKLVWLTAVLRWKNTLTKGLTNYFDPFAGDVRYPLGRRTLFRFERARLDEIGYIRRDFIDKGFWPSSASAARLLTGGDVEVYDADDGRRNRWAGEAGVRVLEGDSGWRLLEERRPDPSAVWLVDPYDFVAEWRERLTPTVDKADGTSLLVYIYNRSGKNAEAFAAYRAFRNALEDALGDRPKRLGRIVADPFLPRAHHEMLFIPSRGDALAEGFDSLLETLEERTVRLAAAAERAAAFDA